jgi:antitoxin HicB
VTTTGKPLEQISQHWSFLACRFADMPAAHRPQRTLGDQVKPERQPYLTHSVLYRGAAHGLTARVCEKDSKDTRYRSELGRQAHEGGAKAMTKRRNPNIGSSFDDFLKDEGIYEDVTATAIKRAIALQIANEMTAQKISKAEMARRMKTSATQLGRLLDPGNDKIQLDTLYKAARAVGRDLHVSLV